MNRCGKKGAGKSTLTLRGKPLELMPQKKLSKTCKRKTGCWRRDLLCLHTHEPY